MSEWRDVAQVLLGSWPSQVATWGREGIAAFCSELEARSLSPDEAIVAIRCSAAKFPPAAGELAASAYVEAGRPTFDEAYGTIYRAAARQQLPEAHPLIVGFIERQGLQRLGRLPLDDPTWGEKTRRELERAWALHVETFDGRQVAALAAGSSGGLRQLDPLAVLPELGA